MQLHACFYDCIKNLLDTTKAQKSTLSYLFARGGALYSKNTGDWLDSLGPGTLVGKRYFVVLQKY